VLAQDTESRPKILCLHGGGGNGAGFSQEWGMRDLEEALPSYEFVYADGGYPLESSDNNYLWIPDPPGGKGEPTTDPAFSDASVANLDALLESEGPFAGILGYSQGAAYVPVYLSRVPDGTFGFAMMFCGYPTLTHQGILETVENRATFANLNSLVWIGDNDSVIPPELTLETIPFFENPVVIESEVGGHEVPWRSDPTFGVVVAFVETGGEGIFDDFEVEIEVGSGNSTDREDDEDYDSEDYEEEKSEDYDSEEYDIGKSEDWDSEEDYDKEDWSEWYDKEEGDWGDKEEGDWSDWGDKEEGDWSDKEEEDWSDKEKGDWSEKEEGDWGDKEEGEGIDLLAGADSESMFLSSSGTTTHSMAALPLLGAFVSLVAASLGW